MAQTDIADQLAAEVQRLCQRIGPLLHGNPPEIVSAALADLLATLLAGHYSGDPDMTDAELREGLLTQHIEAVRKLIPVNEALRMRHQRRH